jgi:methionyl-tRNA formyltransferase
MARIVYFGTGEFAVAPLVAVHEHVVLVVSQPDRPQGRGLTLRSSPVKLKAVELGLPVQTPEKARDPEFVEFVRSLEADFLLVASYGQILSVKLLQAAKYGGINLHGSILPRYRGAAPIQRAIINGDLVTGNSLMQMAKGMDTGDVIEIVETPIGPDETYDELQIRLSEIAATQAATWVERLATGDYPRTEQDHEAATHAAKIEREDAELRFDRTAQAEYNRFRGVTSNPGAGLQTDRGRIKLSKLRFCPESGTLGEVLKLNPLTIAFAEGSLEFHEVQPEGKKRMSGRDWANGARITVGTRLSQS